MSQGLAKLPHQNGCGTTARHRALQSPPESELRDILLYLAPFNQYQHREHLTMDTFPTFSMRGLRDLGKNPMRFLWWPYQRSDL